VGAAVEPKVGEDKQGGRGGTTVTPNTTLNHISKQETTRARSLRHVARRHRAWALERRQLTQRLMSIVPCDWSAPCLFGPFRLTRDDSSIVASRHRRPRHAAAAAETDTETAAAAASRGDSRLRVEAGRADPSLGLVRLRAISQDRAGSHRGRAAGSRFPCRSTRYALRWQQWWR